MNSKLIALSRKFLKIIVPAFAASTSGSNENLTTKRELSGTVKDMKHTLSTLSKLGVKFLSEMPITQIPPHISSPFSSSAFGLNEDYIELAWVDEIKISKELLKLIPQQDILTKGNQKIDLVRHRNARDVILHEASRVFFDNIDNNPSDKRVKLFKSFIEENQFWIKHSAQFSVIRNYMVKLGYGSDFRKWPEEFQNPDSSTVKNMVSRNNDQLNEYYYKQFIIHTQQLDLKNHAQKLGIKREVNIAFGIDPAASGDVWALQGSVFDMLWNVGCSPEPENGYPEQNWGTPQYKSGEEFNKFLQQRFKYLSQYVDIIFIDHLCGYANKYYFPANETEMGSVDESIPAKGHFELELSDHNKMTDNVYTFLKSILDQGMEVGGETMGDPARQAAVESAIKKLNKEGYNIPLMHVAVNKNQEGQFGNPGKIDKDTELFLTTHDLPTILQILFNQRGEKELWYDKSYSHLPANFLSQQFGILVSPNKAPLSPESFTREVGLLILKRLSASSAKTVTIPLQDIFALLFPDDVKAKMDLNVNIPGTGAKINNDNSNFARRFPAIEKLLADKRLIDDLSKISTRNFENIDYPDRLIEHGNLFTWVANISNNRDIAYINPSTNKFELLDLGGQSPILEMVIANLNEQKEIGGIQLPDSFRNTIDQNKNYKLIDIADPNKTQYTWSGKQFYEGAYIELEAKTDHHFIVIEQ